MATVTINEFPNTGVQQGCVVPIFSGPQTDQAAITSSGTSQQSSTFAVSTEIVNISSYGGPVRVAFGSNPTATANSLLISDGQSIQYAPIGGTDKVAVINA